MRTPSAPVAPRLLAIDGLRGLIMAVMALDHARAFVGRAHPFESWDAPLPHYDSALPFLTRLVTHLCAPGFFLLMGIGMVLLADARRRDGWSANRIMRFFLYRGFALLIVEQVIENPAWILGMLGAAPAHAVEPLAPPSPANGPMLVFGVLYALAVALMLWSLLLRLPTFVLLALSAAATLLTQWLTPTQAQADMAFAPIVRLLLVPGRTGIWFVLYPAIPWLGCTGVGLAFGRMLARQPDLAYRRALGTGIVLLGLFVVVRLHGGFGNIHAAVPPGWIGFLNVTKYPPSLAFVLLTLGSNLILVALLARVPAAWWSRGAVLLTFGRTALFFYIVHLYVYALAGFAFPHGAGLAAVYAVWLGGLFVLYPLCKRYQRFKQRTPSDSLWRLF